MPSIPQELPNTGDVELTGFLNRLIQNVNLAFLDVQYFEPKYILPTRVRVGEVHYFGAAIPTTAITGEGLWAYKSTGWTQII